MGILCFFFLENRGGEKEKLEEKKRISFPSTFTYAHLPTIHGYVHGIKRTYYTRVCVCVYKCVCYEIIVLGARACGPI